MRVSQSIHAFYASMQTAFALPYVFSSLILLYSLLISQDDRLWQMRDSAYLCESSVSKSISCASICKQTKHLNQFFLVFCCLFFPEHPLRVSFVLNYFNCLSKNSAPIGRATTQTIRSRKANQLTFLRARIKLNDIRINRNTEHQRNQQHKVLHFVFDSFECNSNQMRNPKSKIKLLRKCCHTKTNRPIRQTTIVTAFLSTSFAWTDKPFG